MSLVTLNYIIIDHKHSLYLVRKAVSKNVENISDCNLQRQKLNKQTIVPKAGFTHPVTLKQCNILLYSSHHT